ncbi:hypothetical protein GCM10023264_25760 [Sphingomonas daechungensis]|uniref:Helix-turn-helix transcriptional regulator n=1 Tax=Sphingomonas daechungensis TaxID=1176646 RepID=A0ABX6T0V3_9SPHN|nr:hypothetical protein [Sphingomonas daechungensis]QNP43474.1 hypothetical protein H9L15_01300 [Sphingomonas daechungensis]
MVDEHPYANTRAAQLLASALRRKADTERMSVRAIGKELGYKQAVVLSHMANGRVPIPVDRATDIARAVGLPEREFLLAVLHQRHDEVDWSLITSSSDEFVDELEAIAGRPLSTLPAEHRQVMREIVAESRPERRWLSLAEVPVMELIRAAVPYARSDGMPRRLMERFATALRSA